MTLRVFDFRCMNEYTHSVDLLHIDLGLLTGECFLKVQFVVSLNWRQSISHHITSLSGNAYFMSGRCMWNRKGSFVKSSRFEDRTFFAEQSLVDLELETCIYIYIDVCSLARQGVPACLCIFVSRYIRYIYETHIISKPGNIFHTWSIWRVKSSPKIRLQHDRLGKSLGLTVFFKGPLVYFFRKSKHVETSTWSLEHEPGDDMKKRISWCGSKGGKDKVKVEVEAADEGADVPWRLETGPWTPKPWKMKVLNP